MDIEKKIILIVDDNDFFIKQQIGCLGRERFNIHTAVSGKETLDKVRSLNPDLLLLDHIMEDMTGPEVCRQLKADPVTAHIPIIIVSSGERITSRLQTDAAGCDAIIFKPIRSNQLITLVEEFLGLAVRRGPRASVTLSCTVNGESTNGEGTIYSLGNGGAFIEGNLTFLRGDTCGLQFSLPEAAGEISVREAIVVWIGRLNDAGPVGAGLEFLTISKDDQEAIYNYVANIPASEEVSM